MLEIDTTELSELGFKLGKLQYLFQKQEVIKAALTLSVSPTLKLMKATTPVSSKKYIPSKHNGDTTYARGGALKAAARKEATLHKKRNETQVIVGYSKKTGKAGWRAHFLEYGYRHYLSGKFIEKPWMRKAEANTRSMVEAIFESEMQKEIDLRV